MYVNGLCPTRLLLIYKTTVTIQVSVKWTGFICWCVKYQTLYVVCTNISKNLLFNIYIYIIESNVIISNSIKNIFYFVLHEGFEPPTVSSVVMCSNPIKLMEQMHQVPPEGFEPSIFCLRGSSFNQLSYRGKILCPHWDSNPDLRIKSPKLFPWAMRA